MTAEAMEVGAVKGCIQDVHTRIDEQTVIPTLSAIEYGAAKEEEIIRGFAEL
jgi:hypothetical protein